MTLIKSISGIRGTIGGKPGDALTPVDTVKFAAAFGTWVKSRQGKRIVIGRDARISGEMVSNLVCATLQGLGLDVIDLGLSTTPTVEIAVPLEKAGGGIILTASHNPIQWNALKLLNEKGEFISAEDGATILKIAADESFDFAPVEKLGSYDKKNRYIKKHIELILKNKLVDKKAIQKSKFKIVVDAVNSTGGISVPELLKALGVKKVKKLYCEPTGKFPHNPEPLPENIKAICREVKKEKYDLGIVVDPDVDRLALIQEDGKPFGEEYTLVAVADYVLSRRTGNTVSNLSSTRALRDVTEKAKGKYTAASVGEVNVVTAMRKSKAVIGGEGNGGVIFPELHYGRDALMGIALFLTHLAKSKLTASELRKTYPNYFISKNKIELTPQINVDEVLEKIKAKYASEKINTADGVKIDFEKEKEWVHLRKSNTEPIIRIYAESENEKKADELAKKIIREIQDVIKN
ncbi:MAG: phosphoglucosamine mutase [Cytophagales bacterium]|jgi:phosphomannomutase|nr:phosphoglucosamine mutase [Cytophagales bacterium]MCA6387544.1 phosphoglucosamine mutase [Cytophagales bacterium]MCA6391939.1 phosphoglucosamine mutase [Cytophagales bacterium]MCA6396364.1 phosphoglucosamine mutase [Cytophagales bacterium]MCA6399878.1 phosphoglucosamine mutase [Cytophagales bacterium]